MKRRHFLVQVSSCLSCCLLPRDLIRRAEAALAAGDTTSAIAAPDCASSTLYALDDGDRFLFSLGSTRTAPNHLTWRQWAEINDADIDNGSDFKEFAIDWGLLGENEGVDTLFSSADEQIPDRLQDHYLEGVWATRASPQASAHHYLRNLEIGTTQRADDDPIGELNFWEGPCPGSSWTWVEADRGIVLPALQHRLLELHEDTRIELIAM